jgi:prolyl oligopeptidase
MISPIPRSTGHRLIPLSLALALTLMASPAFSDPPAFKYPEAPKGTQVDDYFGTKVPDPYRWLEDADSAQTKAWVEEENKLTFDYLRRIPSREHIEQRLTKLWNYEKYGVPQKEGGRYFFAKNTGLQNQSVIFTTPALDQPPKELLDPNKLSSDGTVALDSYAVSDNGQYMAYGLQTSGSDWVEWLVKDVATGIDLPDHLKWSKFSTASWTKDGKGFFYSRYDAPNEKTQLQDANYFHKLYYHVVGEEQSKDTLIYERKDEKEWLFDGTVTDDGRYLIIEVSHGTEQKNRIFYRSLGDGLTAAPVVELLRNADARYIFAGNQGPIFYFVTFLDAPRGRLVAIDTTRPGPPELREIVPQAVETLDGVNLVGGRFIASYLKDAHTDVRVFELDGTPVTDVPFPGLGTASGFGGKPYDTETFYAYTSFTTPPTIYRYDVKTGETKAVFAPKVDFKPADYTTEQVFFPSKDGTNIPMFISYKKGLVRDGNNPTVLYGYGGFSISLTPAFSPADLAWMEMGGVYAVPNLRGGGEYGEEWHQVGTKAHKQNVFDDFIAAAEWLIAHQYTSTPKLAISGGSNGGLLIGACMTQRPDLFGAALPAVGVMDMLRFQKFTIGWAWASDYGSSDNPADFKTLYAYSPLQHLKPGVHYPATLITTSDHDDRVVPAHSFKFAATLQADQAGPAPVLIRIETKSGHGAGRPTSKRIAEVADSWAFLDEALAMSPAVTALAEPTIKPSSP